MEESVFIKANGDCVIEDLALLSFLYRIDDTSSNELQKLISNMSRVIEAFVFFERLFVFSFKVDNNNGEAYYNSDNPLILASIIEELSKENILNFVYPIPNDFAPQPSALLSQVAELKIMPSNAINDSNDFRFGYYLYQQEVARRFDIPFISSDSQYAKSFVTGSSKLKSNLSQKLIHNLNLTFSKEFEELIKCDHDIDFLVPPFLSIVLDKVIKGASFGEAILDLRMQFKPIRNCSA